MVRGIRDADLLVGDPISEASVRADSRSQGSSMENSVKKHQKAIHKPWTPRVGILIVSPEREAERQRLRGCLLH